MIKQKEEMLEKLRNIQKKAQININAKEGYENYVVKNVIHYTKKVELINKESGQTESLDLCLVEAVNPDTNDVLEIYYLNGTEADFTEILRKYESPTPIKDVVDKTKENEAKHEEEQNEEYGKYELEKLEKEKELEDRKENQEKNKQEEHQQQQTIEKKTLTGTKLKYAIQSIDVDNAYIDDWTTVRKGFNLPAGVKEIAIAKPMQEDENVLSSDMTMYMLDSSGCIVEEVKGKTIEDYFEIDNATGKNPISDENTKLELGGYAERNEGHTMRRFKSKENPNLYLSAEQKEIGGYAEVYAGRKTMDGNHPVEVQLETRNVGIQTSLAMQKVAAGYKGIYNIEDIDKEVDEHEAHGDDESKIAIENADGNENTAQTCNSSYIPGTEMTWEELAEETGESITELQERFERELKEGKNPEEILDEIEYDYGMVEHERDRRLF